MRAGGQRRLAEARVAVVGAGGLGSPALTYLAAAGVGHLTIIDGDAIEYSNLNRQVLYGECELGCRKARTAAAHLRKRYPEVQFVPLDCFLTAENASSLLQGYDCIVSCVDRMGTRLLIDRTAQALGLPVIEGGVVGMDGFLMCTAPQGSDLTCVFGEEPEERSSPPQVFGAAAGVIGSMQALLCLQYLLAPEEIAYGVYQIVDLQSWSIEKVRL